MSAPRAGGPSPWGAIQHVTPMGPDATVATTAGHGGVWISEATFAKIPKAYKALRYSDGQWFEEDCDWCIPYLALRLDRFEATPERGAEVLAYARDAFTRWHKGDPGEVEGLAVQS